VRRAVAFLREPLHSLLLGWVELFVLKVLARWRHSLLFLGFSAAREYAAVPLGSATSGAYIARHSSGIGITGGVCGHSALMLLQHAVAVGA